MLLTFCSEQALRSAHAELLREQARSLSAGRKRLAALRSPLEAPKMQLEPILEQGCL